MASVVAVSKSSEHNFSKAPVASIHLLAQQGVEGDAHCGSTVKHRSRVKVDPTQPNLRQVHLIHQELLEELQQHGFKVAPATLGENITTAGLDLLSLPKDTLVTFPSGAQLQITGLRNPCAQLDNYQAGLTAATLDRDEHGQLIRKAGIMAVVNRGGDVHPGDAISIELPAEPHQPLERV